MAEHEIVQNQSSYSPDLSASNFHQCHFETSDRVGSLPNCNGLGKPSCGGVHSAIHEHNSFLLHRSFRLNSKLISFLLFLFALCFSIPLTEASSMQNSILRTRRSSNVQLLSVSEQIKATAKKDKCRSKLNGWLSNCVFGATKKSRQKLWTKRHSTDTSWMNFCSVFWELQILLDHLVFDLVEDAFRRS